jgi:hypothetical protein
MSLKNKHNVFNVLHMDFSGKEVKPYDVLPYFRDCWKSKYNKEEKNKIKETGSKELLKTWIENRSLYMFWARTEWEFLIGAWPYGSKRMYDEFKEFISTTPNVDNYDDRLKLDNIIIHDMEKIDVHRQIMMNIDIITNILYDEFLKKKEK